MLAKRVLIPNATDAKVVGNTAPLAIPEDTSLDPEEISPEEEDDLLQGNPRGRSDPSGRSSGPLLGGGE